MTDTKQTKAFEAEVAEILELVTHSLYSDDEIFLREFISNASDAADKLRYEALSNASLYEQDPELSIHLNFDKELKTLTISDNGIGMSQQEVIDNLGTIAQSGTRKFKELLSGDQAKDSQLIGQFGVGFYSAFIVAEKVVVKSRRAGLSVDEGVYWESDGKGEYTIDKLHKTSRGTEITLHLKEKAEEFLDQSRLRTIIRKYSDHILLPIMMPKIATAEDKDEEKEKDEVVIPEFEKVNDANALWTLPRNEITDEQYADLYKHISHDFEAPLTWSHNKVEGSCEYTSLLYIPKRAPFDLYDQNQRRGLKLYVKRVFIMDDAEHFMPAYMRFMKGIVDSNDLPLNVSRELLQSNKEIDRIRSGCVKRVLSMLEKMANTDAKQYQEFWGTFGQVLKEGPAEDFANKERVAELLRFASTHEDSSEQNVSFADYVERMSDDADTIYYLIGDTYTAAKNSPLLEMFRKKGVEVLLMSDRVDEWLVSHLTEYKGKQLKSISQGDIDLGEDTAEEKEAKEKTEKGFESVVKSMKDALGEKVSDVRLTHRLTDSPCCVVFDDQGMSGHMQRMLKAAGQQFAENKPILEINPGHDLIVALKADGAKDQIEQWSDMLLGQALLSEGEQLKDPAGFVKLVNQLLAQ